MYRIGDLEGKRVLVTGASSGIGAALAKEFAAQGARLALHYHAHGDAAETLVQAIRRAGGEATAIPGELTQPGQPRRVIEQGAAVLKGLDVLINNAGSLVERRPILEVDDALVDRIFNLNARAVISTCQAAARVMQASGGGAIVNTGSIAAMDGGGPGSGVYAAAKAFVHTLTRHLARELAAHHIRVNCVSPGVIDTPFHAATPRERMEVLRKSIVSGRLGQAQDCVGAFLFLASQELSGYITGQTVHVNGGQWMA